MTANFKRAFSLLLCSGLVLVAVCPVFVWCTVPGIQIPNILPPPPPPPPPPVPEGAFGIAEPLAVVSDFPKALSSVSWSHDGTYCAVATEDLPGTLHIFRFGVSSFNSVVSLDVGKGLSQVVWHPTDEYIVTIGRDDQLVRIYRFENNSLTEVVLETIVAGAPDWGWGETFSWHPRGDLFAIGGNSVTCGGVVRLCQFVGTTGSESVSVVETGSPEVVFGNSVGSVEWSPRGDYLLVTGRPAVMGGYNVRVYAFNGSDKFTKLPGCNQAIDTDFVAQGKWSRDGKFVLAGCDGGNFDGLQLYSFNGTELVATGSAVLPTGTVHLNVSHRGNYAVVGGRAAVGNLRLFDFGVSGLVESEWARRTQTQRWIHGVAFSPDDQFLAVAGNDESTGNFAIYKTVGVDLLPPPIPAPEPISASAETVAAVPTQLQQELQAEVDRLNFAMEQEMGKRTEAEKARDAAVAESTQKDSKINELEAALNEAKVASSASTADTEDLRLQIQKLSDDNKELETALNEARSASSASTADTEALRLQVQKLLDENVAKAEEIQSLNNDLKFAEEQNTSNLAEVEALLSQITALTGSKTEQGEEISRLSDLLKRTKEELNTALLNYSESRELADLLADVLQTLIVASDDAVGEFSDEIVEEQFARKFILAELQSASEKIARLSGQIATAQKQIDVATSTSTAADAQIIELRETLSMLAKAGEDANDALGSEVLGLQDLIDSAQYEYDEAEAALYKARSNLEQLILASEDANDALNSEVTVLRERLSLTDEAAADFHDVQAKLEANLATLANAGEEANAELNDEIVRLQEEVRLAQKRYDDAAGNLSSVRVQLESAGEATSTRELELQGNLRTLLSESEAVSNSMFDELTDVNNRLDAVLSRLQTSTKDNAALKLAVEFANASMTTIPTDDGTGEFKGVLEQWQKWAAGQVVEGVDFVGLVNNAGLLWESYKSLRKNLATTEKSLTTERGQLAAEKRKFGVVVGDERAEAIPDEPLAKSKWILGVALRQISSLAPVLPTIELTQASEEGRKDEVAKLLVGVKPFLGQGGRELLSGYMILQRNLRKSGYRGTIGRGRDDQ